MLYQISDGSVSVGGNPILSHINFEIKGNEKIAVIGENGSGKTTLLQLIAGKIFLDRDDKRNGKGITTSKKLIVKMLSQHLDFDLEDTVEQIMLSAYQGALSYERERFEFECKWDRLFIELGFQKEDKKKKIKLFSGGQKTRISLIHLLLERPDILLLDEPTNHLDMHAIEWLESYLKGYDGAVVMVSHDRFFLDRIIDVVYEISEKKIERYVGNYSNYQKEKKKREQIQNKKYIEFVEEEKRLGDLVERFKHKPKKASFARAKKKQKERLQAVEKPHEKKVHFFVDPIEPEELGSKIVLENEELVIGYDHPLLKVSNRIRRGQKIGLLGSNGVGKTTYLKTIAGLIPKLGGKNLFGNQITIGYFDQDSGALESEKTVLKHFGDCFPSLSEKEIRSILGKYLFRGRDVAKRVSDLSGGEKSRLVLAELLQGKPNFLILDEPTNHMDIWAKETLESAFQAYTGTILFISHDRYFIKQVAKSILIFEEGEAHVYPFDYEHYLDKKAKSKDGNSIVAQVKAEDQKLIDGMRAVPKAERHRLTEISTESTYLDWKRRLLLEEFLPIQEKYEKQVERFVFFQKQWEESENFWYNLDVNKEVVDEEKELEINWENYHRACMHWYEIWREDELDG